MMKCQDLQNDFRAYLDGELKGRRSALVEKHLSECQECSRKFELVKQIAGLAKHIHLEEPPSSILENIMQTQWQRMGNPSIEQSLSFARGKLKSAIAIAAGILIAVVAHLLYTWAITPSLPQRTASIRKSLASVQAEIESIYAPGSDTPINPALLDDLEKSRTELEACEQSIEAIKISVLNKIGRIYEANGDYEMALAAYRRISETTTYPEAIEIMNSSHSAQSNAPKRKRQGA